MRALALILLLAACASGAPPSGGDRDPGGSIVARMAEIDRMERAGRPYRVAQRCSSACTMYLGLSTACFPPDGVLRFHSASIRGPLDPPSVVEAMNRQMAAYYPPRLRRWFLERGPGATRSTDFVEIPVSALARRGELRLCP